MACSVTVCLGDNDDAKVEVSMLTDTTQYIIFSSNLDDEEIDVNIIIGEKKFRQYALNSILPLDARHCTRNDIDIFLAHHDASYFSEKEQPYYEQIIKNHLNDDDDDDETKEDNTPYQPNIASEIRRFYILRPFKYSKFKSNRLPCMYRYPEKNIIENMSKLCLLTTEGLISHMITIDHDNVEWTWKDVIIVSGTNFKIDQYTT